MDVPGVVREVIEHERSLGFGATIVIAVSGGADSLCLLHVLNRLRAEHRWSFHIAHLNHCLRGTESDEDMAFVTRLAMDYRLPCTIEVIDVKTLARQQGLSVEETGRQVRYGFFTAVAHEIGATAVAVGHHADDQAETVLMHLLRGTGLAGLAGMLPSVDLRKLRVIPPPSARSPSTGAIHLVRPLLGVPRVEIERYCQLHKLSPRIDRTNLDITYFRNRLRHELLPLLETYNPNIRALLRRTAAVAVADYELLTDVIDDAWARITQEVREHSISFDLEGWRELPLALQRATLRRAAFCLRPQLRDVDFVHIKQAVDIAVNGSTGAIAILPHGLQLTLDYQDLRLFTADAAWSVPDWPLLWRDEPVPVAIPGRTELPAGPLPASRAAMHDSPHWSLETQFWSTGGHDIMNNPDRWTAYLDADRLGTSLALRRREPGDRFQPLGMDGRNVEVADFMINAKIPRRWRGHLPLLVHRRPGSAGKEEIAWMAGWRIDERVKISPATHRMVRLRWQRIQRSKA